MTRDDTTRYLCAAVHEDARFADRAIREFLVEDTRPVPPATGLDTTAVLAEAIAARTRRKLRDTALLLLFLGLVLLAPLELVVGWFVVALVASINSLARAVNRADPRIGTGSSTAMVLLVLGAVVLSIALEGDFASFGSGDAPPPPDQYPLEPDGPAAGVALGVVSFVAAVLAVTLWDRLVVWRHLRDRFWPNQLGGAVPPLPNRTVLRISPERYLTQLWRHHDTTPTMAHPARNGARRPGQGVPLTVYRGFEPFVGAGLRHEPWSIAVPLEPIPDAEPTIALDTDTL